MASPSSPKKSNPDEAAEGKTLYSIGSADDIGRVLARNLRQIRQALGLTQDEFAEAAGLTQPSISRLERAGDGPGWHTMRQLAHTIQQAGGDPMDLIATEPVADQTVAEIRRLLPQVDDEARRFVLKYLQREAEFARLKADRGA